MIQRRSIRVNHPRVILEIIKMSASNKDSKLLSEAYQKVTNEGLGTALGNLGRSAGKAVGGVAHGLGDVAYGIGSIPGKLIGGFKDGARGAAGSSGKPGPGSDTWGRWNRYQGQDRNDSPTLKSIFKRAGKDLGYNKDKDPITKPDPFIGPKDLSYKNRNDPLTNQIKDTSELEPGYKPPNKPNNDFDDLEDEDPAAADVYRAARDAQVTPPVKPGENDWDEREDLPSDGKYEPTQSNPKLTPNQTFDDLGGPETREDDWNELEDLPSDDPRVQKRVQPGEEPVVIPTGINKTEDNPFPSAAVNLPAPAGNTPSAADATVNLPAPAGNTPSVADARKTLPASTTNPAIDAFNAQDVSVRKAAYNTWKQFPNDFVAFKAARAKAKLAGYDLHKRDFDKLKAQLEAEFETVPVNEWVSNARLSAIRKKVRFNHQVTLEEQHILNNIRSGY
jgi:hypothetical protein